MFEKNTIPTKGICGMIELKPEALAKNKGIKVVALEEARSLDTLITVWKTSLML
jgi:hypothetical protein